MKSRSTVKWYIAVIVVAQNYSIRNWAFGGATAICSYKHWIKVTYFQLVNLSQRIHTTVIKALLYLLLMKGKCNMAPRITPTTINNAKTIGLPAAGGITLSAAGGALTSTGTVIGSATLTSVGTSAVGTAAGWSASAATAASSVPVVGPVVATGITKATGAALLAGTVAGPFVAAGAVGYGLYKFIKWLTD